MVVTVVISFGWEVEGGGIVVGMCGGGGMEAVLSGVPCNCSRCCCDGGAFSALVGFSSIEDADECSAWPSSPGFFLLEVAPSLVLWVPFLDFIFLFWSASGRGRGKGSDEGDNTSGIQLCGSEDLSNGCE